MTTIAYHESLGYRALEQGENPHPHWQQSEHMKKEQDGNKKQKHTKEMDPGRRRGAKDNVDKPHSRRRNRPDARKGQ